MAWAWLPGLKPSESFFWGTKGPKLKIVSYGDSVASGYDSSFWLIKLPGGSYADHYGRDFNANTDRSVKVENRAWAGYTMGQILNEIMDGDYAVMQDADLVLLEGGGNDFLDLYKQNLIDLCDPNNFNTALQNAEDNFSSVMDIVDANTMDAEVKVMGMYYPLIHKTRTRPCETTASRKEVTAPSVHIAFLSILAKYNWFLSSKAKAHGYTFVDVFPRMNCKENNWSDCEISQVTTEEDYHQLLLSIDQKGILQDPGDISLSQKDDIHPNFDGHEQIAQAIFSTDSKK